MSDLTKAEKRRLHRVRGRTRVLTWKMEKATQKFEDDKIKLCHASLETVKDLVNRIPSSGEEREETVTVIRSIENEIEGMYPISPSEKLDKLKEEVVAAVIAAGL